MVKNGDIVYFKEAYNGTSTRSSKAKFKGYAMGMVLGHVPPFAKDPSPEDLMRLMGSIGVITFDLLGELFGEDMVNECVKKFEEKYYPQPESATSAPDKIEAPADDKVLPMFDNPLHH